MTYIPPYPDQDAGMIDYLHIIPHPALLLDQVGRVLAANPLFLELGLLSHEDIKGKYYNDFFQDVHSFLDFIQELEKQHIRYSLTFHNGLSKTVVRSHISLIKVFYQASLQGYILIISELGQTGWHRVWPLFLQSLYTDMNMGLILVDKELRILGISDMACRLFGVERDEVNYRLMDEAFPNLPDEFHFLQKTVQEGLTFRNYATSWTIHGRTYDLLVDSYLLTNAWGAVEGAYMTLKDVTNLRSLEYQLQRNDRLAMIGQIAAGTAHEIRNPLTSIKGFLQMLNRTLEEKGMFREKGYTDVMLAELERINHLVSEFLLLGKKKEVQYRPLQVVDVLREILPIIETQAHLNNVEVLFQIKPNLPLVRADSELLKQVFLNIAKNGIEAMEEGGKLTISQRLNEEEQTLMVVVRDTGPGIPAYVMDRIFDPFFTTKEHGTGLGLSVCQKILHDMGGNLTFSTKGYGTTFYIHLPLA